LEIAEVPLPFHHKEKKETRPRGAKTQTQKPGHKKTTPREDGFKTNGRKVKLLL